MKIKNNVITYGDGRQTVKKLLIADDGYALTKDGGENTYNCVASDSIDGWAEVSVDTELSAEEALEIIVNGGNNNA